MSPPRHQRTADAHGPLAPVSVVVLTLNEEVNIRACLASCAWSDDVHVLDSGSTDQTVQIARDHGARVWTNPFTSFGAQRNWAIDNIPFKHDWVFHLDADERFTPELVRELDRVARSGAREAGFLIPNRLIFLGRWLKRSAGYPTFQMRYFHRARMRFTDYGHGQREDTGGKVGRLETPYLHYSFSKGLYDWFDKHNRYSSLEAIEFVDQEAAQPALGDLLSGDSLTRRRAWKRVLYGVPFWPWVRQWSTLLLLGGILEGRAGMTYASLLATYERMIQMKLRLLRAARASGDPRFEADAKPGVTTAITDPLAPRASPPPSGPAPEPSPGTAVASAGGDRSNFDRPARLDDSGQILPEASPWTFKEKLGRAIWMLVGRPVFRATFHNWYGVRRVILRAFGAKVARGVRLRPSVRIEIPWNLDLGEGVIVGDEAILYALGKITIGPRAVVSQYAHVCAGTHDHTDRRFPLIRDPIHIGAGAWIGTDAFVGPRVRVGDLAVLGARSSAYKDLEGAWVHVGNPAKSVKPRGLKEPRGAAGERGAA